MKYIKQEYINEILVSGKLQNVEAYKTIGDSFLKLFHFDENIFLVSLQS
jgi:hypothetical protein